MTVETHPDGVPELNREAEKFHEFTVNELGYDADDVLVRVFGRSGRAQVQVTFERGIGAMD